MSAAQKKHDHSSMFRKGIQRGQGTRHREETSIRIRKEKREARFREKRRARGSPTSMPDGFNVNIQLLTVGTDQQKLDALVTIRKMLSLSDEPPIKQVVEAGLLPIFVSFLHRNDNYHMQFEAAWVLTNVASGPTVYTKAVIDAHAIPPLVTLLNSPHEDVREQVIWVLGNITGDCIAFRDHMIQHGIVPAIIKNFNPQQQRVSTVQNTTWTLSNVCRGKPAPPMEIVAPIIPVLAWLIQYHDDDTVADACWALCYITDGDNERIEAVVAAGVCMRLVELMNHPSPNVQTPAVRTIGNIVTGSDHPTQAVIDSGAIPMLTNLMDHDKSSTRKEVMWALSNIAAGSQTQIQRLIDGKLLPKIISMAVDQEFAIRKEAIWTLANITSGGTESQIEYIVHNGCLEAFNNIMSSHDIKIVVVCLESVENILKTGERDKRNRGLAENPYAESVEMVGLLDCLELLQDHEEQQVYTLAVKILEQYFAEGTEEALTTPQPSIFDFSTGFQ